MRKNNEVMRELRSRQMQDLMERLRRKTVHGFFTRQSESRKYPRNTSQWLVDGRLRVEREATIVAAQDGVTHTRAYRARILKENIPMECSVWKKRRDTGKYTLKL